MSRVWSSLLGPYLNLSKASLCGVCSPAPSDSSAQRRKWRVLVPILHFWNSLGKEAPLHLLLFVVADIISFPDQPVRVSCHSVKILLCYWEGFVGGRERGREQERGGKGEEVCVTQGNWFVNARVPGGWRSFSICPQEILLSLGLKPLCLHLSAYAKLKVNRSRP